MPKKHEEKKQNRKWDERSTQRTARFIATKLQSIEDDLGDLVLEFRAMDKFDHIIDAACAAKFLGKLRKKYERMADGCTYDDEKEEA